MEAEHEQHVQGRTTPTESCLYVRGTSLPWDGSILNVGAEQTDRLKRERFVIVSPFRKQISSSLVVSVIDQLKPLFGLCKLGVHVVPSEIQRDVPLTMEIPATVEAVVGDIDSDSMSFDSLSLSSSTKSSEWTIAPTSSYAVIARKPLPEGYTDVELSHYLKDTVDIPHEVRRQLCMALCFRWLLGNSMKKSTETRMFLRAVDDGSGTVTTEVHLGALDSHERYFDEGTCWDSFLSSLSYRLFVPSSQRISSRQAPLTLAQKCLLNTSRVNFMTSFLEQINSNKETWPMSRLLFEWRRRIEATCRAIHPSTLWIGNFVMRRIAQHLQSVDYHAELIDDS